MSDKHQGICRKTITDAAILTVEAETNGYHGGDGGHGGFALVRLIEEAGGGFSFSASHDGKLVELEAKGDSEIYCLLKALKFAVHTLEAQIHIHSYSESGVMQ